MHFMNDHLQTSNLLNHTMTRACKGNDESSNPLFIHSFIHSTHIYRRGASFLFTSRKTETKGVWKHLS